MDEFFKYVRSLPDALDEKEQELLFYEYAKTKDPKIREKLIEHNLKLCSFYALKYCQQHNTLYKLQEVNSDCIIGLIDAVEKYYTATNSSFTSFAYGCMKNIVRNKYIENSEDALFNLVDTDILDQDGDVLDDGIFRVLKDEKESSFIEEISENNFIADIVNYINSWENEKYSQIIKMYCGLDGYHEHTQMEISKTLNIAKAHVSNYLSYGKMLIKNFIAENYPLSFPKLSKELSDKKEFGSIKERNDYIVKRFFGIDCERIDAGQLSEELCLKVNYIHSIISGYRKSLSSEKKNDLTTPSRKKKYSDEINKKMFDAYFGINGYDPHYPQGIIELFNLTMSNDSCFNKINTIKHDMIKSGEYSAEEIANLESNRKAQLKKKRMEQCSYMYYSYYGLNGYEKKSSLQLSKELGIGVRMVTGNIKQYEEYLKSQGSEELAD